MPSKKTSNKGAARQRAKAKSVSRPARRGTKFASLPHKSRLELEFALNDVLLRGFQPSSAQFLIGYFAKRLEAESDEPLSESEQQILGEYLRHAFGHILRGRSADAAFGLKRGRGLLSLDHGDRNLILAALVEVEVRNDTRGAAAINTVASNNFPKDTGHTAVRDAYRNSRLWIQALSDVELAGLAGMKLPTPRAPRTRR